MMNVTRPCVRCGINIPAERLEVLPETRLCVGCSEAVGSDYKTYYTRVSLGKTGSLKKNYGDYELKKVRRHIAPLEN